MASSYASRKEKKQLKGFTRITMFVERKLHEHKQEVLEAFTLCSPLNQSLNKSDSIKLSINNITRPKDILGESIMGGLAAILENTGMSVDFDQYEEPSYIKDQEANDSPKYAAKHSKRSVRGELNQKSMYFTYGEELDNHFNRK